ncbi:hypothetical protein OH717_26615 [Streptomyces albidoflavus]|nr:hypothetical protein OH717_26615 [Streptomyces albidoflavus]
MNNQSKQPISPTAHGHQLVVETLHTPPNALRRRHSPGSAENELAELVARAALHLDTVQKELVDRCTWAAQDLNRVATGTAAPNSLGVLQNSGLQIDLLAARRADAKAHLRSALAAYQRATNIAQRQRVGPHPPLPTRTSPRTR